VNADGIASGYTNDFGWPGETGGRYGKVEKDEAGTAHAGLPSFVVALSFLPHQNQEINPGKITYCVVIIAND